ncbi:hypothetical protein G6F46_012089 [Rhizopus delemar]|nr:hypothetical protein G6F46_012089 [Rhizopus delemar]
MLNLNAKIPLPEKTEFQFFKDNTLSNWKFEDCLQFRLGTDKSGSPLGANKIFSQYCQIMNEIKTKLRNEEVKKYVTKLLNSNDYKGTEEEEEEEEVVVIEDVDVNIWEVWTKVLELMKEENINQYRVYVITLYVAWNI